MSTNNCTESGVQPKRNPATRLKSPARGWNSWLTYGFSVNEQELLHEADAMSRLLGGSRFDTLVLDAQWYVDQPKRARAGHPDPNVKPNLDKFGRFLPSATRFPCTDGESFRPLVQYLARSGQKLGVHLMRGIPRAAIAANMQIFDSRYTAAEVADLGSTCKWNLEMHGLKPQHPGSRDYYRSVIRLIADWGVDYVKYDDLGSPYHEWDIVTIREALDEFAPHVTFSLSPGPVSAEYVPHARAHTDSYRVGPDLWDRWEDVAFNAKTVADLQIDVSEGLPDMDMLPIGRIGKRAEVGFDRLSSLSPAEIETMLVWCSFVKSPLMLGGEIDTISKAELAVLASSLLREVHQSPAPVTTRSITDDVLFAATEVRGVPIAVCVNLGEELWCGEGPNGIGLSLINPHSYQLYRLDPNPTPIGIDEEA